MSLQPPTRKVLRALTPAFALAISLAGFSIIGLSACDSSATGAADPHNIQDSIHAFLTPALIDSLKKYGMPIHEGSNPPNIEGFFYSNSQKLKGSNVASDKPGKTFRAMSIKLFGQNADQRISLEYDQTVEKGSGTGAFITGSGSEFTIYVPLKAQSIDPRDTVDYETAVCYSGRIDTAGIHDFVNGLIVTKKDKDSLNLVLDVGQGRVIEESDSLAAKVATYPFTGIVPIKVKANAEAGPANGGR